MKYEKDFQAFYNKYSRLYNSDRNYYQATVYNHPYYQYIVQPQDKYREPFIHASKFNNDRLTEKIGYEKLEPFPYRDFRMSTPLYRSQMDLTSRRRENTYQKDPQQLQQQQEQDHYARNQYSEAELKYYNDFIKQKEYEEMEKGKMHQPQHVVDYAVTPGNESQKERNVNPYYSNNQFTYSNDNSQIKGLSPIQLRSLNKHTLSINPYSSKDINIGDTNLSKNPIIYPLELQKNSSKKMCSPSSLLGSIGNSIILS